MVRNSRNRQLQQVPNGNQHQHANELLNFHFSTPASTRQNTSHSGSNFRNRGGNNGRNNRSHKNKNSSRRSARDRASVRQMADSSMFYLHSSAAHSFLLTRRSPSKMNPNEYSFHGSDKSVSWDSVRMVQQRVPICDDNTCPICLCDFVCARISKCGHTFCLHCILRHVQTSAANNPYQPVKCPCCGVPIIVEDMRPVTVDAVRPVILQQNLRMRKLHRQKLSSAPFLPIPGAPQHGNPHFAPTAGIDLDAKYSRFNYVDPDLYHACLVANQGELQRELEIAASSGLGDSSVERMYLSLALEMVLEEQQKALQECSEEKALMARFAGSNSGMYQPQSPALVFEGEMGTDAAEEVKIIAASKESNSSDAINDLNSKTESSDVRRYRGNSVGSYRSVDTTSTPCSNHHDCESDGDMGKPLSPSGKGKSARKKLRKKLHGSMYLDTSNSVHLYQAEDGQLVFLNGFNMTCLLSDFSKGPPSDETPPNATDRESKPHDKKNFAQLGPLPDFIEGRVLEKENVHLTSEIRKRMPFLNHIPLYTDILFVELDLNHVLSEATRRKFKNDIAKRRKKRQSKVQAEKRADALTKKEDQDRINARKARLQTVDPDDEFFHAAVSISAASPETLEPALEGDEFGPVLGGESSSSSNGIIQEAAAGRNPDGSDPSSSFSFSQAAQRANTAEAFPALSYSEAFPTLGAQQSSSLTPQDASSNWRSVPSSAKVVSSAVDPRISRRTSGGKKTKKKGQKLVLFSTGGARGY